MKENPYSKMIEIMKKQSPVVPSAQIGEVVTTDPLTVKIGDLQIDKDNILIADYLLKEYKRKIKVPKVTATGETNSASVGDHGTHKHSVDEIGINEVEITFLDTLKQGDKLAIVPTSDRQTYIILARVVSL